MRSVLPECHSCIDDPPFPLSARNGGFSQLHIDGRIHKIYVFLVQLFPQQLNRFAKPLEMDDLALPQEFDDVIYIRIIRQPQNVVIGHSGFLLCCNLTKTTAIPNFLQVSFRYVRLLRHIVQRVFQSLGGRSGRVPGRHQKAYVPKGDLFLQINFEYGFPKVLLAEKYL